jgi:hypothetical protein
MTTAELRTVRGAELVNIRNGTLDRPAVFARARQFVQPVPLSLVPGERLILATRMHWCLPICTAVKSFAAMPITLALSVFFDLVASGIPYLQFILWSSAAIHEMHMAYLIIGWRTHLLVVTSRRFLSTEGVFVRRLKEVNIGRRTNLEVADQSIWGRLFNYGQFRIEMAGVHDDGALRELISFIPDPHTVYHACCISLEERSNGVG